MGKFVILEISSRLRRHAWRDRRIEWDAATWEQVAASDLSADRAFEQQERLDSLREAMDNNLTDRQRKIRQKYLRERQPKTLIFWGQNDIFFTPEGGEAYLRDLPDAEMHRLDSGHFALEDCLEEVAQSIRRFYDEKVATRRQPLARKIS